jgi:hypothetical protein
MEILSKLGLNVNEIPNECPYCHKLMHPEDLFHNPQPHISQFVFKCTNTKCQRIFIANYYTNPTYYSFANCNIGFYKRSSFDPIIEAISPSFVKIYNESFIAEQNNLFEICGVGYRKAIEFLIKDYLISKYPEKEEIIKDNFLLKCIKDHIDDVKIKDVAERAVWLGNDETHYVRKWEKKNLKDLKNLIILTLHWMEMVELHNSMIEDMPEKIK